ncbi:MAG: ABC transporter substrate-binding protein [Deltaproteobacteria bacterium]|nr:ABC transporter substrate-binding protein [Deltaproteobacteria bacterium]
MADEEREKGMTRRDFVKTVGVAAAAGGVLSVGLPKEAQAAKKLKIGFMGPFTGPASRTGDQFKRGIKMALEDARAAGEIPVRVDGKTMDIEPVWVDSQSSPEKAVKAVTHAVNRGVKMMVTGWHSSVAMACMDAEAALKIVHIGHQGESQYINFKINDHPHKYRGWFKGWASPPVFAGLYGPPLKYFMEKGLWRPANRKAAVIVEDTDYGRGWGDALVVSLRTAGFDVMPYDVNAIDQTEFTPIITKYKAAGVSVVAVTETGGVPMYNFVKQVRAMNLKALLLAHGLTWTAEWYKNTMEASDYALCMDSPYPISPEQKEWMRRFKAKYGVEAGIAPSGQPYDHTRMAIKILNEAGTIKNFEKLVEHVREKVKYKGVWQLYDFATYNDFWKDFSEEGTLHQLSRNDIRTGGFMKGFFFPMVQMFGGKPNILWPLDLATAEFKAPPWI